MLQYVIGTIIILMICLAFSNQYLLEKKINLFESDLITYFETSDEISDKKVEPIFPFSEYTFNEGTKTDKSINLNDIDLSNTLDSDLFSGIQTSLNMGIDNLDVYTFKLYDSYPDTSILKDYKLGDIVDIVYGSFPQDNSNEVLIDETMALSMTDKNISKLIGQELVLNNKTYVISGIYSTDNYNQSVVYTSFDGVAPTHEKSGYICTTDCDQYVQKYAGVNNEQGNQTYFQDNKKKFIINIALVVLLIGTLLYSYYSYHIRIKIEKKFMEIKGIRTFYYWDYILITIFLIIYALFIGQNFIFS